MNSRLSRISLPVVGGVQALIDAGAVPPVTAAGSVGATVPATLALTLGAPATFPAFTPGLDRTYDATTTATVTSSAGDALLSTDGGRLANGAFTLAEPLQVAFSKSTWDGPTANENVTIGLKQHIGATEPLRTGTLLEDAHVHPVNDNSLSAVPRAARRLRRPDRGADVKCACGGRARPCVGWAHLTSPAPAWLRCTEDRLPPVCPPLAGDSTPGAGTRGTTARAG